jgi:hypothetical protein
MFPVEIFCLIGSLGAAKKKLGEARVGRLKPQVLETHT